MAKLASLWRQFGRATTLAGLSTLALLLVQFTVLAKSYLDQWALIGRYVNRQVVVDTEAVPFGRPSSHFAVPGDRITIASGFTENDSVKADVRVMAANGTVLRSWCKNYEELVAGVPSVPTGRRRRIQHLNPLTDQVVGEHVEVEMTPGRAPCIKCRLVNRDTIGDARVTVTFTSLSQRAEGQPGDSAHGVSFVVCPSAVLTRVFEVRRVEEQRSARLLPLLLGTGLLFCLLVLLDEGR